MGIQKKGSKQTTMTDYNTTQIISLFGQSRSKRAQNEFSQALLDRREYLKIAKQFQNKFIAKEISDAKNGYKSISRWTDMCQRQKLKGGSGQGKRRLRMWACGRKF